MTSPCPVVRTLTAAIDCAKQTHNVTGVTSQLRPSPGLRLVATVTNVPGLISDCHASSPLELFPPFTFTFCYYCCAPSLCLSSSLRRHSWFPKMKRGDMSGVLPWPVYSSPPFLVLCHSLSCLNYGSRDLARRKSITAGTLDNSGVK